MEPSTAFASPPGRATRILVISMAGIGDTLLATPLIHELRSSFPDAKIDSLVLWAGSKDLMRGNPHLNTVHQRNLLKTSRLEAIRFLKSVGREGYDISINTHPQSRIHYRLAARIISAPVRISHCYECCGVLDRLLVNRTLQQDYERHTVENNLDVLPLVGKKQTLREHRLELFPSEADRQFAAEVVAEPVYRDKQRLGVHVGSGGTKNLALKRWPLQHYIELLRRLTTQRPGLAVVLFGGPEEEAELTQVIRESGSPQVKYVKTASLLQAAALIEQCHAFLSVDTALMHVAAAVGARNQIVIEAPTFNKTNEPYKNPFVLVRNPAVAGRNLEFYRYDGRGIKGTARQLRECMASVTVESVFHAVDRALNSGRASLAEGAV